MFAITLLAKLRTMAQRAARAENNLMRVNRSLQRLKDYAIDCGALPEEARDLPISEDVLIQKIEEHVEYLEDKVDKQLFILEGLLENTGRFQAIVDNASDWKDIEEEVASTAKIWSKDPSYVVGFEEGLEYINNTKKYKAAVAINNMPRNFKF